MKKTIFIFMSCLLILSACKKETTEKPKVLDYYEEEFGTSNSSQKGNNETTEDSIGKNTEKNPENDSESNLNQSKLIINKDLINYKDAKRTLPEDSAFLEHPIHYYLEREYVMFDEEWIAYPIENPMDGSISMLRMVSTHPKDDLDGSNEKARKITSEFLKNFDNIIYTSNNDIENLADLNDGVIRILADLEEENLYVFLNIERRQEEKVVNTVYEQVYISKKYPHNLHDYFVDEVFDYMAEIFDGLKKNIPLQISLQNEGRYWLTLDYPKKFK